MLYSISSESAYGVADHVHNGIPLSDQILVTPHLPTSSAICRPGKIVSKASLTTCTVPQPWTRQIRNISDTPAHPGARVTVTHG